MLRVKVFWYNKTITNFHLIGIQRKQFNGNAVKQMKMNETNETIQRVTFQGKINNWQKSIGDIKSGHLGNIFEKKKLIVWIL